MPDALAALRPRLKAILDRAIQARACPGAVVHLEWRGQVLVVARGQLGYKMGLDQPVDHRTVYDLASLSKLWTLSAALLSMRMRRLSPDTPLCELLTEFDVPGKRAITLRHLMMHSSGIGFAIQSLVPHSMPQPVPREQWLSRIAGEPLVSEPGSRVLYSCTNYFLLARALRMDEADSPLQALIADGRSIYANDGSSKTLAGDGRGTFAPQASLTLHPMGLPSKLIAPTEADASTGEFLRGVVHDEAARFWSSGEYFSFAGNAGLFGDVAAVAGLARLWLREGCFHPGDIERALGDTLPEGADGTRRGWGWQIDNPLFCGRIGTDAPRGSFGHAGFTGPTLWAHRATQSLCIVLSNRVHPTRNGPNRFPFHREISALLGEFGREHEARYFD